MNNILSKFPFRTIDDVLNDNNIKVSISNLFTIIGIPQYPYPNDIINRLEQSYLGYYLAKQLIAKHIKIILNYTKNNILKDEDHIIYGHSIYSDKIIELFMLSNQYQYNNSKKYNGIDNAMCAICHEATHVILFIGDCQWAEAVCKASELIALTNDSLTKNEIKNVVKWARNNYKDLKWKNKNIKHIYYQNAFSLLSFADIIPMRMSSIYLERIKAQIYENLIEIYESPLNINNLKLNLPDKNYIIEELFIKNKYSNYSVNINMITNLIVILKELYKIDLDIIQHDKIKTIEILKFISDSCNNKYKTKWNIVK